MRYIYGMRLRGFAPGCQPKEGFVERRDSLSDRYFDLLVYDRKLLPKEEWGYDLDYICKED